MSLPNDEIFALSRETGQWAFLVLVSMRRREFIRHTIYCGLVDWARFSGLCPFLILIDGYKNHKIPYIPI